jgi:hypothetical protein
MGSQNARACFPALALIFGAACGEPAGAPVSSLSTPADAPDLSLTAVSFARLSDGRIVARGNAQQLDFRRAGGRLHAMQGAAAIVPEAGTSLAEFGTLRFTAPAVEGEIGNRRGTARGGVRLDTARGDTATTDRVAYDAEVLHTDAAVQARGPGYRVAGGGLAAKGDGSDIRLLGGVRGQLQVGGRR